jgi:plasmid stability protein
MVGLTIRNIPEEILRRIRILAAKNRRSMNSEISMVIEDGLKQRISDFSAIYRRTASFRRISFLRNTKSDMGCLGGH